MTDPAEELGAVADGVTALVGVEDEKRALLATLVETLAPLGRIPNFVGPIGPEGPQGETGPAGTTGATGAAGPKGTTGLRGLDGLPGRDGADGLNGTRGADGLTGPRGLQGFPGTDGQEGPRGPRGDKGGKGDRGPRGQSGGGGGGASAIGVQQDGTPKGSVGTLNFEGATVEVDDGVASVSGFGGGGSGSGLPPGGSVGQVVTNTAPGEGDWEDVPLPAVPRYEVLMASGITFPPDPIANTAGDDWLYGVAP